MSASTNSTDIDGDVNRNGNLHSTKNNGRSTLQWCNRNNHRRCSCLYFIFPSNYSVSPLTSTAQKSSRPFCCDACGNQRCKQGEDSDSLDDSMEIVGTGRINFMVEEIEQIGARLRNGEEPVGGV